MPEVERVFREWVYKEAPTYVFEDYANANGRSDVRKRKGAPIEKKGKEGGNGEAEEEQGEEQGEEEGEVTEESEADAEMDEQSDSGDEEEEKPKDAAGSFC